MTEQQIPLPFRKPARLSAAQRKAMMQTKLQDYPVDQAAREAKRMHHVIEQFKNEQLSLWGGCRANPRCSGGLVGKLILNPQRRLLVLLRGRGRMGGMDGAMKPWR